MADIPEADRPYLEAAFFAAVEARRFLEWMEGAAEQLAPERSLALAEEARRLHGDSLSQAKRRLEQLAAPESIAPFAERLRAGFDATHLAYERFSSFADAPPMERIPRILEAIHHVAIAQETFYLLREPLQPFHGFWDSPGADVTDVPAVHGDAEHPPTGVVHVSKGGHHGGFSLYVPEAYTPAREWPVIVALHGGSGTGRDFLWTWLREARSRDYILLSPTSAGDTWSEADDRGLLEILTWLGRNYRVEEKRILLTGLSDGATFALLYGLAHPAVYRAIAPLCGVLHPANQLVGNLERAAGRSIYLVHGAKDFLFPVMLAHVTRDTLTEAGAALTYRELSDLSHTYPRSENSLILDWFEALCRTPTA